MDALRLIDRRPHDLPGRAQRAALPALAPLPRLLLLGAVLALDLAASDALLARLRVWAQEHKVQTVLATHDATDALATGAEVALLHEGRLAALGRPPGYLPPSAAVCFSASANLCPLQSRLALRPEIEQRKNHEDRERCIHGDERQAHDR